VELYLRSSSPPSWRGAQLYRKVHNNSKNYGVMTSNAKKRLPFIMRVLSGRTCFEVKDHIERCIRGNRKASLMLQNLK